MARDAGLRRQHALLQPRGEQEARRQGGPLELVQLEVEVPNGPRHLQEPAAHSERAADKERPDAGNCLQGNGPKQTPCPPAPGERIHGRFYTVEELLQWNEGVHTT